MAILKCKMCGGDLNFEEGATVVECEYCGTRQTVPNADSEKKITLFGRANRLRFGCEFDKASGVYESIVADFPEEAEAYWGLVLCKYGIEYVDDPATGKKVPTCHRSSFESVMEDDNFEQTLENADPIARSVYREEAKRIEELRKGIIEVSGREEPYDIFLCYKETAENGERTIDSVIAQDVYDELVEKGYRVFFSRITLEDKLGQEYEPYIFAALNSAKIMLAFGTDYEYYNAVWVRNEWSRFLQLIAKGEKKTLIPCYKGIDAYDMPKEFAKLQAQDMGKIGAVQDLLRGIEKLLPKKGEGDVEAAQAGLLPQQAVQSATADSLLKRAHLYLEDQDWKNAADYCNRVLDIAPENAEAYLGLLMAELRVGKEAELGGLTESFGQNKHFLKALCFVEDARRKELEGYRDAAEMNEKREEDEKRAHLQRLTQKRNELKELHARAYIAVAKFSSEYGIYAEIVDNGSVTVFKRGDVIAGYNWRKVNSTFKGITFYTDGTVRSGHHGCNETIAKWKDIIDIVGSNRDTTYGDIGWVAGLKSNGSVIYCSYNTYGALDKSRVVVENAIAIVGDGNEKGGCLFALNLDGTVTELHVGEEDIEFGDDISNWDNIVAIAEGQDWDGVRILAGIRLDGTVVATATDNHQAIPRKISDWRDIIDIRVGYDCVLGLKRDGTVVAASMGSGRRESIVREVEKWRNIIAITTGEWGVAGLQSGGTILAAGSLETSIQVWERKKEEERRKEEERKLRESRRKSTLCQYCGGEFKAGLFAWKCSACGKTKDY